jgi:DNA polymerase-3 subunit delta'
MRFEEVIGQKEIKSKLIQSVTDNRISHAQLFLGPEGSGSFPLALAFAQYILCQERTGEDSCGGCPSCVKMQRLVHPDLHFVYPVAVTRNILKNPVSDDFIGEWRNFVLADPYIIPEQWYSYIGVENKQGSINRYESAAIMRKLNLKPFEADYKTVIVWLPEKMNDTASNKLLKILEEPPPGTIFLLVSENTDDILPTVLSRTQIVRIPAITDKELHHTIAKRYDFPEEKINDAVLLACGNYNRAVEYLNAGTDKEYQFEMFVRLMRLAYAIKLNELLTWVDEIGSAGREKQKSFLQEALRMTRENFLLTTGNSGLVKMTGKERAFSEKFSSFISMRNIEGISDELNLACSHIEANGYSRLVFLDLALKLSKLIRSF